MTTMLKESYKLILILFVSLFVTCSLCINYQPTTDDDLNSSEPTQKCVFVDDDGKTIDLTPIQGGYSYFDAPSGTEYHYGICSPNKYCQKLLNTDVEIESCGIFSSPNVTYAISLFDSNTNSVQVYTEVTNLFYYRNVGVNVCPGNGLMSMQLELNCNYYFNFTVHTVLQARTCNTIISIGTIHACEAGSKPDDTHVSLNI
ncbi:hypothetical protein DDB_G0277227 [Dictyostelium discoideum AX4]|uniref:MRH domain-containing protein n=1 Tax=Dictyostelium discoideum TaxID=44689 RepID=Q86K59_DICDI|nr:hypothetical protein DDB_G0277227 [Dictyostelium discoideum AX4]EAL68799.1 hypothetical protein DDB_G0277227 [Dictyostelium discoideum AX4]|eukprot:XP_642730.1 hypothetical protein DDB_G0277227 [Dictyostelium discoideum AX4]